MFNQSNYSDTYEREKLRILQTLNVQIQSMAVKLDQIVSQVEENVFKIKSSPKTLITLTNVADSTIKAITNNTATILNTNSGNMNNINTITLTPTILNASVATTSKPIELQPTTHQLVKIIDEPMLSEDHEALEEESSSPSTSTANTSTSALKSTRSAKRKAASIQSMGKNASTVSTIVSLASPEELKSEPKAPDTTAKRNKQQRQFNTFVRESINQLLGADFMKTHDVQDIDQQVMEMIRKEAVENYLPDNIRPRRAWHLAKASLRTLKRTLNNRKT